MAFNGDWSLEQSGGWSLFDWSLAVVVSGGVPDGGPDVRWRIQNPMRRPMVDPEEEELMLLFAASR